MQGFYPYSAACEAARKGFVGTWQASDCRSPVTWHTCGFAVGFSGPGVSKSVEVLLMVYGSRYAADFDSSEIASPAVG